MLRILKELSGMTWDLFTTKPEDILTGHRPFRAFTTYQRRWQQHFYPGHTINHNIHIWFYLQKYVMPLILRHASSWHADGIRRLELDSLHQPDFREFQQRFAESSRGFQLVSVHEEIEPRAYFRMIADRKFPCVPHLRPHSELFCGNEPDFMHEAVGHIAPLCSEEVQHFYLIMAEHVLTAMTEAEYQQRMAFVWTMMEYGFIKQQGEFKMFGAAMTGSHLAHMRYHHDLLYLEPACFRTIAQSGFYEEDKPIPRTPDGRFRFFYLENLDPEHVMTMSAAYEH